VRHAGKRIASGIARESEGEPCFRRIRFGRDLQRSEAIDVDCSSFQSRVPAPFLLCQLEIGSLWAVLQSLRIQGQRARTTAGEEIASRRRMAGELAQWWKPAHFPVSRVCRFQGISFLREPREKKIGRAVLTIALALATAMLVLAVAAFIDRTTGVWVRRGYTARGFMKPRNSEGRPSESNREH
jgi:hypothetical protein